MYMNIKVIVQVAYMSAFRPSFCLNGSFARVLGTDRHTHTHTHTHTGPITLPLRKRGVIIIIQAYVMLSCLLLFLLTVLLSSGSTVVSGSSGLQSYTVQVTAEGIVFSSVVTTPPGREPHTHTHACTHTCTHTCVHTHTHAQKLWQHLT